MPFYGRFFLFKTLHFPEQKTRTAQLKKSAVLAGNIQVKIFSRI